jgi:elongation factor P--(R)-beta-lysine ligase
LSGSGDWRPTASWATLRARASALAATREFFRARNVLEVETPALVNAPVADVNLASLRVAGGASPLYLHTSPEYAMKRLLAAGSGDIYQICHVYRAAERGRQHNPEFTMVEWYRLGFSLDELMREVADLARLLLGAAAARLPVEFVTYREAVQRHAGIDPLEAMRDGRDGRDRLAAAACALGLDAQRAGAAGADELLDLIVGAGVGPALGAQALTFVHRYPASQAALAKLDPEDARVALRFELYHRGIELANGYHELASGAEQRLRFAGDLRKRTLRGLPAATLDARLLAALDAGLPECAGVALGFDRLMMLALGVETIDEVLAFPVERA